MSKVIMSGDEAVARGAWEAGVGVAAAYPGTPSTEILENMALYKEDVYCQWANNEKIAVEIALGASFGGLRSLAAFKHVGMNAAADPIFSAAYISLTLNYIGNRIISCLICQNIVCVIIFDISDLQHFRIFRTLRVLF